MALFSKLFGGDATKQTASSETYEGFTITPTPQKDGGQFRICALIEKDIDGQTQTHKLVRADTLGDLDSANAASIGKAKQMIDEQGDAVFGKGPGTHG
ncbi:MAG: HlyU family transcriptional regulator [Pseudomonadota bacterium]